MQIKPILAALRRHKAGTVLIALQIALTLAIVCNAMFIIHERLARMLRPSGVDEANVFVILNQWADKTSAPRIGAQMQADLLALRGLPGVLDATAMNTYPLRGSGWDDVAMLSADQLKPSGHMSMYFGDDHSLSALGVRLLEGRNFTAAEVTSQQARDGVTPKVAILTKGFAERLFPGQSALGKSFYLSMNKRPVTVIGVTDTMQAHTVKRWASDMVYSAVLLPAHLADSYTNYVVHARPGQLEAAMREAHAALMAQNPMRIIEAKDGMMTYARVRQRIYERDRGMALLLGIVCAVLLVITAAGIVGLTSFWVGQRRKQIGVRRALGARQRDILGYFLTENLLISTIGVAAGVVLALAMNLWMVQHYELSRLSLLYVLVGVAALLALGQGAVLAPALRASRVSPVEATRTI